MFFINTNGSITPYEERVPKVSKSDSSKDKKKDKKNFKKESASKAMKKISFSLSPETSLEEAWHLIKEKEIYLIPVLSSEGKLLGLLKEKTLLLAMKEKSGKGKVKEIMQSRLLCTDENTNLSRLAPLFFKEKVEVMPVINNKGKMIGLITPVDILRVIIKLEKFLDS